MELKTCTKCNRELTIDKFGKHKGTKDNLNCRCKECCNKQSNTFREENPEKSKEIKKKYTDNNVEKTKERKKIYHKNNVVKDTERVIKWRRENPEKSKAYSSSYNKKYHEENREHENEYRRNLYLENFEKESERHKKYNAKHLVEFRKYNQNRRAIKLLLPSTFTTEQWEDCKQYFNNECCYCGKTLPLEQEHLIPVTKGGAYSLENIVCACKSCNTSKGNKDFNSWYSKFKHYSKKRENSILEYLNYKNGVQQITFAI